MSQKSGTYTPDRTLTGPRLGHDEDAHIDGIEELRDQIGHMTLPLFPTTQIG